MLQFDRSTPLIGSLPADDSRSRSFCSRVVDLELIQTLKIPIELFAKVIFSNHNFVSPRLPSSHRQIFENVSNKFLRSDAKICTTMSKGHQRKSQCKHSRRRRLFCCQAHRSFHINSVPYRLRSLDFKPRRLESSVLRSLLLFMAL